MYVEGMLSAAASLGMILLWDVDGGLTQIDKYLYSSEDYIKVNIEPQISFIFKRLGCSFLSIASSLAFKFGSLKTYNILLLL